MPPSCERVSVSVYIHGYVARARAPVVGGMGSRETTQLKD